MKTLARQVWTLAAAILLSGGATTATARSYSTEPLVDFTVVSSSSNRRLTSAELDQLQAGVERFLASRGYRPGGEYVVRIDFPPAAPGLEAEWVMVKLTNVPVPSFTPAEVDPAPEAVVYYSPFDDDFGYPGYAWNYPTGFYDPWCPPRVGPGRPPHVAGYRPDDHRPRDNNHPHGNYPGDNYGDPHRGGSPTGRDHPRTADNQPRSPGAGHGPGNTPTGHAVPPVGGSLPHASPPPRQDHNPAPPPAPRQVVARESTDRDNRYK